MPILFTHMSFLYLLADSWYKSPQTIQLVSMALSTISIHMATIDIKNTWDEKVLNFIETIWAYLKSAFVGIPTILFKTGSLAVIFSTLKYGGMAHVIVSFLCIWLLTTCLSTSHDWEVGDFFFVSSLNIFTTILADDNSKVVRICAWVHYIINMIGLVVCYILAEKTEVTLDFKCGTDYWLKRDNLQIACGILAACGLLSCILTEVYLYRMTSEKCCSKLSKC